MPPLRARLWFFLLGVLLLGACGDGQDPGRIGAPTWFALEPVGAEDDARVAFDLYPRWFHGMPKLVSVADIERERRESGVIVDEAVRAEESVTPPGMRWIPTSPPLPRYLDGIPRTQQGARLALTARILPDSRDLELRVSLHATERALWRETEHRAENAHPFLFGVYADGAPLLRPYAGSAKCGGISRFYELVPVGRDRTWVLVVGRASVAALLGKAAPRTLGLVAVFSERQHDSTTLSPGARPAPDLSIKPPFGSRQFVIRSEITAVRWEP